MLEPECAEISYPKNGGLQGPENIKINPNAKLAYRRSGWPFIEHSTFMALPLISEGIIKSKAITVQLNFTQKSDHKSVLSNEKALSSQPNVLSNLEQQKADFIFMNNNNFTDTNLSKKIWLDQVQGAGYFLSKHEIIEGDMDVSCLNTVISAETPTGQATESTQPELLGRPRIQGRGHIPQDQGQPETKTQHET